MQKCLVRCTVKINYNRQKMVIIPIWGAEPLSDYRQTSELTTDDFHMFVYVGEARKQDPK